MIGIVYGSTTGNTETIANDIHQLIGEGKSDLIEISTFKKDDISKYDTLILGASTWGLGDLQDDWESGIELFKKESFEGKKITFFGCGDQEAYADTFVDSLGIIYEAIKDSGAEFIGSFPVEGYTFDESKAVVNGKFIGLPIDEDCQSQLTGQRLKNWVDSLGL